MVHEEAKRNGEKWEVSSTLVLYKNNVSVQTHTECKSSCFQADGGNIKIDSLNKIIADFCFFLYMSSAANSFVTCVFIVFFYLSYLKHDFS